MTYDLPIAHARKHLDDVVRRARADDEPVILTEHDNPVAAVVSIERLHQMQQAEDAADIAECLRSQADSRPRLTQAEVLAFLEAEDAAGA